MKKAPRTWMWAFAALAAMAVAGTALATNY